MTDKEIIEIDGINVLECEHYQYKSLKDCEMRYPESGDCEIGLLNYLFNGNLDIEKYCKDNPNCYFKQLARKTQECEELKKQLMQKSEVDMFFNTPIEGWSNDPCGICPHKAENEELKERLVRTEEDLKYQCVDCMNVKSDRYRKALEEIEEVCLEDTYTFADGTQIRYDSLDDILDIINKAKGDN